MPLIPILDESTWEMDNNAVGVKMMLLGSCRLTRCQNDSDN